MFKVDIHPYNPVWPGQFSREADLINDSLKEIECKIEHVGSTSVPGMAAKPIIDILVGVSLQDLDKAVDPIQKLGYIYNQRYEDVLPRRRYLVRYENDQQLPRVIRPGEASPDRNLYPHTHHVHMVPLGCDFWRDHLLFRDFLRNHPKVRDEYLALKLELAQYLWEEGAEYSAAKHEFIEAVMTQARQEADMGN